MLDVLENLSAYLEWGGQLAELEVAACRRAASQLAGLLEGELSARCRDFAAKTGGGDAALETARTLLVDVIESPAFDLPEVRAAVDACLGESVLTAAMLVFVDCMKELPMTVILRPFNFHTLATYVHQFASDEQLGEASLAALAIIGFGVLPVIVLSFAITRSRPGHTEEDQTP